MMFERPIAQIHIEMNRREIKDLINEWREKKRWIEKDKNIGWSWKLRGVKKSEFKK